MNELIKFWKELNLNSKPFIHPRDKKIIKDEYFKSKDFEEYIKSDELGVEKKLFYLNLLPRPYAGNISTAKVFILTLNPGFHIGDYYEETYIQDYINDAIKNLNQELSESDFPFIYLNPKYLWTPGGQYWSKKLKDCISMIKDQKKLSYRDALSFVSKRIVILELIPYHSKESPPGKFKKLESVVKMKKFVKNYLIPKAKKNELCIICTRSAKDWEFELHNNIVIYQNSETRNATLSKNSSGYKRIMEFLNR